MSSLCPGCLGFRAPPPREAGVAGWEEPGLGAHRAANWFPVTAGAAEPHQDAVDAALLLPSSLTYKRLTRCKSKGR